MMIDLLLKYGANIDVRIDSKLGYSVLMKLAATDFVDNDRYDSIVEVIQFLIERGADKNFKGYDGKIVYDVVKQTPYKKEFIKLIKETQQTVFYTKSYIESMKSKKNPELDLNDVNDLRTNCCTIC